MDYTAEQIDEMSFEEVVELAETLTSEELIKWVGNGYSGKSYIEIKNKKVMKKFIVVEQVPALVEYTYEVEAENEDDALELVSSGLIESVEYTVDTIYESNVRLDFTRQVIEEED